MYFTNCKCTSTHHCTCTCTIYTFTSLYMFNFPKATLLPLYHIYLSTQDYFKQEALNIANPWREHILLQAC